MCDDNGTYFSGGSTGNDVPQVGGGGFVEGCKRFVEEKELGIHGKQACKRYALRLTTRQAPGSLILEITKSDGHEFLLRPSLGFLRCCAVAARTKRDILEH